jgi:hypothetical protein
VPVGHGDQAQLLRGQPERERATVVLDQYRAEPLQGPEDRAVDHHRPVPLVVVARVLHVEALGKGEVALDGRELPQPPERVAEVEIDLRSVERPLAFGDPVLETALLECQHQRLGGAFGGIGVYDRLSDGQRRELDHGVREAEGTVDLEREVEDREDLVDHLIGCADDVRVVLGPPADPEQPVERAGLLVAIDRAELRQPHRKVPVAPHL